jgi:hypothetical protein
MMGKCRQCGQEFEISKEDKNLRGYIELTVKLAGGLIDQVAPGLSDAIKDSKGCCGKCWHENTDTYTQALQGLIGKKKESGPQP